jgi:acetylglutamate/LysW-gamma-L-alpha-aminoadipate kinase
MDSDSRVYTRSELVVVKIGGSLGPQMRGACADIRTLVRQGCAVLVVHGGAADADRLAAELGRPTRYLTSPRGGRSRYTDAATLDILTMALLGRVKPALVAELLGMEVPAVGLSGIDGHLVTASRTGPARVLLDGVECVVRDDLTGRVANLDTRLVRTLLDAGYVPVVSPPALDPVAGPLNVDGDRLAAALAAALGADWLIVLSNVVGLLRDRTDPASLVARLPADRLTEHLDLAEGRMRVKLRSAGEAYLSGVRNVVLADGRRESPILAARHGAGTVIVKGAP